MGKFDSDMMSESRTSNAPSSVLVSPGPSFIRVGSTAGASLEGPYSGSVSQFETVQTFSEKFIVLTRCIRNWYCDSNGDLNRGSNHKSRDLKVRFELPETAICGKFLRFGLRDFKSLAICDLWFGARSARCQITRCAHHFDMYCLFHFMCVYWICVRATQGDGIGDALQREWRCDSMRKSWRFCGNPL